jgi:hypothetical protein
MIRQSKIAAKSEKSKLVILVMKEALSLSRNKHCNLIKEHIIPGNNHFSFKEHQCTFGGQTLHFQDTNIAFQRNALWTLWEEPLLPQGTPSLFQGTPSHFQETNNVLSRNSHCTVGEQRFHVHWRRFTLGSCFCKLLILPVKIRYCGGAA